jgi:hypothetical protein
MLAISVEEITNRTGRWVWPHRTGKLVGPSVGELERIWNLVKEESATGISVNLCAVNCVAPPGEELLQRMDREGVELQPRTLLTRAWVGEIRRFATSCAVLLALLFAARSRGQTSLLVGHSQLDGAGVVVEDAAPALAFGRYLASLQERNPFTESGPISIEIEASIPGLSKRGNLRAIRQTGASERGEYTVKKLEGDPLVKQQVIARYLAAENQAERIPFSAVAVTPTNYKFHYGGSLVNDKISAYVFQITPREKREGLIRGEIWIDPATGVAVHQAGRFVKRPSVFIRRVDVTRDTKLVDGVPSSRVTRLTLRTKLVGLVELTVTERPVMVDAR